MPAVSNTDSVACGRAKLQQTQQDFRKVASLQGEAWLLK
jgi:hypothetical protein